MPPFDRALLPSPPSANHCREVGREVETSGLPCTRLLVALLLMGKGTCRRQPSRPHHPWTGQPVRRLGLASTSSDADSPLCGKTQSHHQPHLDIFCGFFFFWSKMGNLEAQRTPKVIILKVLPKGGYLLKVRSVV